MVQLKILSGQKAGASWAARRFPVQIGRSQRCDFRSEETGVWDEHLTIVSSPGEGFVMQTQSNALATLNGERADRSVLRNGDIIQIGALKIQFWLAEAAQRGLRFREGFVWAIILSVCASQIALIYWLVQ